MRALSSSLGAAIAVAMLAAPLEAGAQPKKRPPSSPASESPASEAKAALEKGRALYAKGEYAAALEALEQAQRLSPDPRLFWNMAACEKKLGHNAKAMGHVERYLAAGASVLGEDEKRDATQFLTAARAYVATVTVIGGVDGVEVFVDDELVGTTPFAKPILVDQGEHRVRFTRAGYRTVDRTERAVGSADLRWAVELEAEKNGAPAPSPPPPPPRADAVTITSPSRVGPLLVGGVGLATAAVGGVLVGLTVSEASSIERDCGSMCPPSRWEKYQSLQTTGDVLLAVGGTALVVGIVWFVLQPTTRHEARSTLLQGRF